jgi:hypothetical protein
MLDSIRQLAHSLYDVQGLVQSKGCGHAPVARFARPYPRPAGRNEPRKSFARNLN